MPILQVSDLVSGYGKINILKGASLQVGENEIVSVIGPNGAGKSTLMKSVFGLVEIASGSIVYRDEKITGLPPRKLVRLGLGFVPQNRNVFPDLTLAENLAMGAFSQNGRDGFALAKISQALPFLFGGSGKKNGNAGHEEESMEEISRIFPFLMDNLGQKAGNLSGGQQQMLAISIALMLKPKLLLLDEPSAGLAPNLVDDLMEKILKIKEAGVAILMIEQNAKRALKISDRGYVLVTGKNEYEDSGRALLDNADIGKLFLGR